MGQSLSCRQQWCAQSMSRTAELEFLPPSEPFEEYWNLPPQYPELSEDGGSDDEGEDTPPKSGDKKPVWSGELVRKGGPALDESVASVPVREDSGSSGSSSSSAGNFNWFSCSAQDRSRGEAEFAPRMTDSVYIRANTRHLTGPRTSNIHGMKGGPAPGMPAGPDVPMPVLAHKMSSSSWPEEDTMDEDTQRMAAMKQAMALVSLPVSPRDVSVLKLAK
eukprot:TRINITY_DN35126_c0_g1_i1.p1 TRINITY_DN35126_c0_g1~~TRINITY_DN35126_c0_g1_i1.p1  ORF type:complete len:219 (+),score=34.36 TRINITY_DN35126_c0_g1_i1:67-723(+)